MGQRGLEQDRHTAGPPVRCGLEALNDSYCPTRNDLGPFSFQHDMTNE